MDAGTGSAAGADVGEPLDPVVSAPALLPALLVYTALRFALVAVLTVLLAVFGLPLLVALIFAILIQLPLAWLLFGSARRRVNEAIAVRVAPRRAERERLRSALAGEE